MSDTPEKKPDEVTEAAQKTMNALSAELKIDGELTKDEKLWGMLGHIGVLAGFVVPFGNIFGPLAVYLMKKDESRFIHFHALQSLIFQIGLTVALFVLAIPLFILAVLTGGLLLIPVYGLISLFGLLMVIYVVLTGVKANEGKWPLYPIAGKMANEKVSKAPPPVKPSEPAPPAPPTTTPPSNPA